MSKPLIFVTQNNAGAIADLMRLTLWYMEDKSMQQSIPDSISSRENDELVEEFRQNTARYYNPMFEVIYSKYKLNDENPRDKRELASVQIQGIYGDIQRYKALNDNEAPRHSETFVYSLAAMGETPNEIII